MPKTIMPSVVSRRTHVQPGRFKFTGVCNIDAGDGEPTEQFDFVVDQFPDIFTPSKPSYRVAIVDGETIQDAEVKAAIIATCAEFSARIARAPKYTPTIRGNVVYANGDAQNMVDDANAAPELAAVLRAAVAAAQPLPAPLGPPLSEHVDTWPQWVVDARALLAKVDA